jgi:hypothetical protein
MVHDNQKEKAPKQLVSQEKESSGGQTMKSPSFQLMSSGAGAAGNGDGQGAGALQRKAVAQNGPAQLQKAPIQRKAFANDTEKEKFFADYKARADVILERWYKNIKTVKDRTQLTGDLFANAARKVYDAKLDTKYIVPVEFALSQARLEGGVNRNERLGQGNVFNVAAYDSGVSSGEKNINTLEKGFDSYYTFMANNMLDDKTAEQLLEKGNFTKGANQTGGVYATNPVYEGEIKGTIGKMHMTDDGFSISAKVGAGQANKPADVEKIGKMLVKVGYLAEADVKDADKVSAAILKFQTTEIAPEASKWFKDRVKWVTNKTDIANMNIHIRNFTDGIISPGGSTLGVLYFMAQMGGKVELTGVIAKVTGTTGTTTPATTPTTTPATTPTTKPATTPVNTAPTTKPATTPAAKSNESGGFFSSAYDWMADKASDAYDAVSETVSGWGESLFGSDTPAPVTTAANKPNVAAPVNKPANPNTPAPVAGSIAESVGDGGANKEADVKIVQSLLIKNGMLPALNSRGKSNSDGDCGPATKAAILRFQNEKTALSKPDGKIDPGGTTWKILTGQSPAVTIKRNPAPATNTGGGTANSKGEATKTDVKPKELTAGTDILTQIQTNFPNGITVALYANYAKTGKASTDNNNAEFPRAAGAFAKNFNAVGFDASGKLSIGLARPITSLDEVTAAITGIHAILIKEYKAANPGFEGPDPAFTKINHLALFSHGMPYGMHLSSGGKYNLKNKTKDDQEKLHSFVTGIRSALTEGVHVSLFACNAGRETDGTEEEGVWLRNAADKQDGSSSFAASLAGELGKESSVYAHLSAGHTVNNYSARVFGADAGKDATTDKAGQHIFYLLYPDAFVTAEATRLKKPVADVRNKMWKHYTTRMSDGHSGKFVITTADGKKEKIEVGAEMFADINRAKSILQADWTPWLTSNPM